MNATFEPDFDTVVVGGGIAGKVTGITLLNSGNRVLIVDRGDARAGVGIGEHVPPIAVSFLRSLSFGNRLGLDLGRKCPGICSYWASSDAINQSFIFSPYCQYGINLDRSLLEERLKQLFLEKGGVWMSKTTVHQCTNQQDGWAVQLRHRMPSQWKKALAKSTSVKFSRISTRILVDATGRRRHLASRMHAQLQTEDRLIALFCTGQPTRSVTSEVHIESTEDGWLYSVLLPSGRMITALFSDREVFARHGNRKNDFFIRAFSNSKLAGDCPQSFDGPVRVGLAESCLLAPVSGRGWLAVGDAASCYDPLSSLGIYKAARTGKMACQAILQGRVGDCEFADGYQRHIERDFREYQIIRRKFYEQAYEYHTSGFWERRLRLSV